MRKEKAQRLTQSHWGLRWLYARRNLAEAQQDLASWLKRWERTYPKLTDRVEEKHRRHADVLSARYASTPSIRKNANEGRDFLGTRSGKQCKALAERVDGQSKLVD